MKFSLVKKSDSTVDQRVFRVKSSSRPVSRRTSTTDAPHGLKSLRSGDFSVLLQAVGSGYISEVEHVIASLDVSTLQDVLLKQDPEDAEGLGRGIMHYLAGAGFVDGMRLLLPYCDSAALNFGDSQEYTPLHYAVASHQTIRKMRNTQQNIFKTDIFEARGDDLNDMLECTRLLCSAGADVMAKTGDFGVTPLHLAVGDHLSEIAVELLRYGAEVNHKDNVARTPLHLACWAGSVSCVSVLVRAGADLSLRNFAGRTPLHVAAVYGHTAVGRFLVNAGADVNAVNTEHASPVVLALRDFHYDFALFMLEAGCNMFATDDDGFNGFSLAVRNAPALVVKVLDQHRLSKNTALSGGYEEVTYTFSELEVTTEEEECTAMEPLFFDWTGAWQSLRKFLKCGSTKRRLPSSAKTTPREGAYLDSSRHSSICSSASGSVFAQSLSLSARVVPITAPAPYATSMTATLPMFHSRKASQLNHIKGVTTGGARAGSDSTGAGDNGVDGVDYNNTSDIANDAHASAVSTAADATSAATDYKMVGGVGGAPPLMQQLDGSDLPLHTDTSQQEEVRRRRRYGASALRCIVHNGSTELILHPVIKRILLEKWAMFGKQAFIRLLCLSLLAIVLWGVIIQDLGTEDRSGQRKSVICVVYALLSAMCLFQLGRLTRFYFYSARVHGFRVAISNLFSGQGLDLLSMVLVLLSLVLMHMHMAAEDGSDLPFDSRWVYYSASVTSLTMWVNFLKLLAVSRQVGPFVRMIRRMLVDMGVYFVPCIILLLGFGQAFLVAVGKTSDSDLFNTFSRSVFTLYRVFSGVAPPEMFDHVTNPVYWDVPSILYIVYLAVSTLLLGNLLEALMNNSFRLIYERSEGEWMLEWARSLINLEDGISESKRVKLPPKKVVYERKPKEADDPSARIISHLTSVESNIVQQLASMTDKILQVTKRMETKPTPSPSFSYTCPRKSGDSSDSEERSFLESKNSRRRLRRRTSAESYAGSNSTPDRRVQRKKSIHRNVVPADCKANDIPHDKHFLDITNDVSHDKDKSSHGMSQNKNKSSRGMSQGKDKSSRGMPHDKCTHGSLDGDPVEIMVVQCQQLQEGHHLSPGAAPRNQHELDGNILQTSSKGPHTSRTNPSTPSTSATAVKPPTPTAVASPTSTSETPFTTTTAIGLRSVSGSGVPDPVARSLGSVLVPDPPDPPHFLPTPSSPPRCIPDHSAEGVVPTVTRNQSTSNSDTNPKSVNGRASLRATSKSHSAVLTSSYSDTAVLTSFSPDATVLASSNSDTAILTAFNTRTSTPDTNSRAAIGTTISNTHSTALTSSYSDTAVLASSNLDTAVLTSFDSHTSAPMAANLHMAARSATNTGPSVTPSVTPSTPHSQTAMSAPSASSAVTGHTADAGYGHASNGVRRHTLVDAPHGSQSPTTSPASSFTLIREESI